MPLVTFKAKKRLFTEGDLELIERGIKEFDDNSDEWKWGTRTSTYRSEDIQSIQAFSKTQTLVWFYNNEFVLVNEPEKKVREKLSQAVALEDIEEAKDQFEEEETATEEDDA